MRYSYTMLAVALLHFYFAQLHSEPAQKSTALLRLAVLYLFVLAHDMRGQVIGSLHEFRFQAALRNAVRAA